MNLPVPVIQVSSSSPFLFLPSFSQCSGIMTIINPDRRSLVSSGVPSVATRSPSSADMIRSRLLFKLGIYDPNFTNASIRQKIQRETCFARTIKDATMPMSDKSLLSSSSSLPGEIDSVYISDPPSQVSRIHGFATNRQSGPKRPVNIRFDPLVTVRSIPSHRSYDSRMRACLYATKDEISFDVVRNTREFIYEGWDWRNVIEEAGMYICKASGEWVHPAHVVYCNKEV